MEIGFSVNMHDSDGDKWDDCILIHINDTFILRFSDTNELKDFVNRITDIQDELIEEYGLKPNN